MKAVVCTKYGSPEVLELQDVPKPTPKSNEICIKIHATTVTSSDCIIRGFNLPKWHPVGFMMGLVLGFNKPRNPILGMVAAGEVDSCGDKVTRFKKGEAVLAYTVQSPTKMRFGTYAQYICIPEDWMVLPKPASLSFEQAAALPYGGEIALYFLKKGDITNRKKILIIGASGTVGSAALQLAKHFGASVTAVCSGKNLPLVKSLGADAVIDYTKERYGVHKEQYDLILDAVPLQVADRKKIRKDALAVLAPGGKFISIDKGSPVPNMNDLMLLTELCERGTFQPVIGNTYPLEQIVDAHTHVETGHKRGNVVITIPH